MKCEEIMTKEPGRCLTGDSLDQSSSVQISKSQLRPETARLLL
jgi:hypothetical protein